MKRIWLSMTFAIGLSLLYTGVVYAQGAEPPVDPAQTGEIAAKLAGLLAAATVIERVIEMIWDFIESNFLTASKAIGDVTDYAGWARKQVQTARANLISATAAPENTSVLEAALRDAEKRLSDYLQSPLYVSMKKKFSVPLAVVLGLVIAQQAQLQMFNLLGLLPADSGLKGIDILITGLVIGTGSAPVHSLIGIIQKTKDTIDSARALYSGKALSDAVEAVKKLNPPAAPTTAGGLRELFNQINSLPDNQVVSALSPEMDSFKLERAARGLVKL